MVVISSNIGLLIWIFNTENKELWSSMRDIEVEWLKTFCENNCIT